MQTPVQTSRGKPAYLQGCPNPVCASSAKSLLSRDFSCSDPGSVPGLGLLGSPPPVNLRSVTSVNVGVPAWKIYLGNQLVTRKADCESVR